MGGSMWFIILTDLTKKTEDQSIDAKEALKKKERKKHQFMINSR